MAEFIYTMHKVRKTAGEKVILDDVTLSFFPGAKIGVVGPNGAGKSTLLAVLAGLLPIARGRVELDGRRLDDGEPAHFVAPEARGVGLSFQDQLLFPYLSV